MTPPLPPLGPPYGERPDPAEQTDTERINTGLVEAEAWNEGIVTDETARLIASQMHDGQWSALYSFASTGRIFNAEALAGEIARDMRQLEQAEDTESEPYRWLEGLSRYVVASQAEDEPEHTPRIWIGDLHALNCGELHGEWIDAARNVDELHRDVARILYTSPVRGGREHYIGDHENFYGLPIDQYESLERVARIATGIRLHGEGFARWLNHHGVDYLDDVEASFEGVYVGEFESEEALAEHLADELGIADRVETIRRSLGWLGMYVEFRSDSYLRDLKLNGDMVVASGQTGGVFAFYTR